MKAFGALDPGSNPGRAIRYKMPTKKKISKRDLWLGDNFWRDLFMSPIVYLLTFPTFLALIISIYFFIDFIKFKEKFSLFVSIIFLIFVLVEIFYRIFKKKRFFVDW